MVKTVDWNFNKIKRVKKVNQSYRLMRLCAPESKQTGKEVVKCTIRILYLCNKRTRIVCRHKSLVSDVLVAFKLDPKFISPRQVARRLATAVATDKPAVTEATIADLYEITVAVEG